MDPGSSRQRSRRPHAHGRGAVHLLVLLAPVICLAASSADVRLAEAVMNGDKQGVQSLLKQHVDVDAPQADGTTALDWAVRRDDLDTADLLIRSGANPKAANRYGITPLYLACVNGNAAMIGKLIGAGADPNSANPGGETALMTASRTGNRDAVRILLDHGAKVNEREGVRGQTALMWAVLENHTEAVKLLLEHGAGVNASTKVTVPEGETMIARPGQASGAGVARQRALPSASGSMTALLFAAREGNLDMARILVDAKAAINQASANGTTPLLVAIVNNHIQLAMFLAERGADPNRGDFYGRTPLLAAVDRRNPMRALTYTYPDARPDPGDPLELIQSLLAHGADPNARALTTPIRGFLQGDGSWVNFDGQTPFLRAALSGDVTAMRILLKKGADPNLATKEGTTPLMAAAGINWVVGQTHSRPDDDYLNAARLCLERGADVNAVNSQGFTAMHGAANRGFDAMIKLLVEHGARVDVKDKEGRTPLTFAQGVFLAINPPVAKPGTIALLRQLMDVSR